MASTVEKRISRRDRDKAAYPVAAGIKIPAGTLFFITTAGFATNVIAAGANFVGGVATKTVDNSSGSAGDLWVEGYTQGQFRMTASGLAQTNVKEKIYAVDNDTLSLTSTNQTYVGWIVEYISATECIFDLDTYNQS